MSRRENGVIIFSRMDSSRFPQKALSVLGGQTLIESVIDRVAHSEKFITVLATTEREIDDPLEVIARKKGIECFRGDFQNVAKRALDCAKFFKFDSFARVNGDSPFIFSSFIEKGFHILYRKDSEMVSNLLNRSYPYGVSVEILKTTTLERAYSLFSKPEHYEHITSFFYENRSLFKIEEFDVLNQDHSGIRLVIDTREDLDRLSLLYERINCNDMSLEELVKFYKEILK